jgi:hypothetical protein
MDFATIKSGLEAFTSATGAVKALIGISSSTKDVEVVKTQMMDVLAKLGEAQQRYIALQDDYLALVDENRQLKTELDGEPCPKCRKKGWHVESSAPDGEFGTLGVSRRLYKCHSCGFSEPKLVT